MLVTAFLWDKTDRVRCGFFCGTCGAGAIFFVMQGGVGLRVSSFLEGDARYEYQAASIDR